MKNTTQEYRDAFATLQITELSFAVYSSNKKQGIK